MSGEITDRPQDLGPSRLQWRKMAVRDLDDVLRVSHVVHRDYPEDRAVFEERLQLYSAGCHVLVSDSDELAGYVLSHPWTYGAPPALDSRLGALPPGADSYYIHDIALRPQARGRNAAIGIVAQLVQHATIAGFATASLIAIAGTEAFWERQGFCAVDSPSLAGKLASYDPSACYMSRALGR